MQMFPLNHPFQLPHSTIMLSFQITQLQFKNIKLSLACSGTFFFLWYKLGPKFAGSYICIRMQKCDYAIIFSTEQISQDK